MGIVVSVQANTISKEIAEQELKTGARIGVSIYDLAANGVGLGLGWGGVGVEVGMGLGVGSY